MPLEEIAEALIFVSGAGISEEKISQIAGAPISDVQKSLENLEKKYATGYGFFLEKTGGKWKFATREEFADKILALFPEKGTLRLTPSAAECLSIILYKGPITKAEINEMRGVDSTGPLSTLLKHKLIKVSGRKNAPGKPKLLKISDDFYSVFGIRDEADIPSWEELGEEEE